MGFVKLSWIDPKWVNKVINNDDPFATTPSNGVVKDNRYTGECHWYYNSLSEFVSVITKLAKQGCFNIEATSISEKEYSRWYRSTFM